MVAVAGVGGHDRALIDKAGRRVFTVPPQWIITVVFLVVGLVVAVRLRPSCWVCSWSSRSSNADE